MADKDKFEQKLSRMEEISKAHDDMYTHGADVRRLREMKELEDLL